MNAIIFKNLLKITLTTAASLLLSFTASAQTAVNTQPNLAKQYRQIAAEGKPVFISTDLAFEQVNFFFADALEQIEKDQLSKNLETGLTDAFDKTAAALEAEKDGAVRDVLSANLKYVLTAMRLLLPEGNERLKSANTRAAALLISMDLRNVAEETRLVLAAEGLDESSVLGYTEDYTQYKPRGRYTASEEQTRYFRANVWLGRMGFYTEPNSGNGIDEKKADFLTAQGAMLLKTIGAQNAFVDYDKAMTALIGGSDDLTVQESIAPIEKATDKKIAELTFTEIISAAPKIRALIKAEARRPRILSTVAEAGKPVPVALRLIGQRFTPDSFAFQNLTFSKVEDYTGKTEPFTLSVTADGRKVRGVPRVFDVLDALGMRFADEEIKTGGDDLYQNYAAQREMVRKEMPTLLAAPNYTTLYLSAIKANDYITDSRRFNGTVNRRQLNSAIGAYILLRHELAAYAKQSYTNVGRGLNDNQKPTRKIAPPTFVENAPQVFANLKKAVEIVTAVPAAKLLAGRGKRLAAVLHQLSNAAATQKQLTPAASENIWQIIDEWAKLDKQSAVVADVHTDLNSKQVLQIGVGYPQTVEITVGEQKTGAAIFTTYEFRQPIDNRLTDAEWRKSLDKTDSAAKFRLFVLKSEQ